ncbi:MAG: ElyC/SanA/YdcF family protein [Synechococcaceae cyanobacterium]|nr:ElyC/SanA/YdcF family protein [Synechococcaceae cyanobacterium]
MTDSPGHDQEPGLSSQTDDGAADQGQSGPGSERGETVRRIRRRRRRRSAPAAVVHYVLHGPPAEIVASIGDLFRSDETLLRQRGPWRRGLTTERVRRRRSSGPRLLRRGPAAELVQTLVRLIRRYPLRLAVSVALVLWWFWPWLRVQAPARSGSADGRPEVITVFVEDPQRVIWAFSLWNSMPGAAIVLQGRPGDQQVSRSYLERRGLWPRNEKGLVVLTAGCDTVGQVTALSRWLQRYATPGRLTVVTSPAHLERSLAIARIAVGAQGWRVEGLQAITDDNRPENPMRRLRDELRAQIWRFTGWNADDLVCRGRSQRMF